MMCRPFGTGAKPMGGVPSLRHGLKPMAMVCRPFGTAGYFTFFLTIETSAAFTFPSLFTS